MAIRSNLMKGAAFLVCASSALALNWDTAVLTGTTPDGKVFYNPGEEMVFTLKLEGMEETLPPNTYFVDWERRGDDGLTEKGCASTRCASPARGRSP